MNLDIKDKVLLFDFDGTLVETEFLAKQVIEHYFKEKNFTHPIPFAEMIVGRTWHAATESMVDYAKTCGIDLGEAAGLEKEFKKRYRELFVTGVKLIPGLRACLPGFKSGARFIGIVTGSDREEVNTILKAHGLENYFEKIWAYGDYALSKPDPSPYLTAMRELQASPSEILVFEDSMAGMESAHLAGLQFVQVTHEGNAEHRDPRALRIIRDWDELI